MLKIESAAKLTFREFDLRILKGKKGTVDLQETLDLYGVEDWSFADHPYDLGNIIVAFGTREVIETLKYDLERV